MATMIPDDIDDFKTEGERRFYRFLESVAKPDREYTTWYTPDIDGREPDFVLLCSDIGLIIFEVKDWALGQIEEADPRRFVLRMGRDRRSQKNPLQQAREYYEILVARMRADGRLLSQDPRYYGKPKVPIGYGVVFPNIIKDEYCRRGLDDIIPARRAFFADDLHTASEICRDGSGNCFKRVLFDMFPARFRFSISGAEYHHLKQLIFPVVKIHNIQRDTCAYIDPSERITVLDDGQESIARKYGSGRYMVSGPPGSGKTLILVHKAAFLKRYNPTVENVLFVCCNPSLVNFIKRLLSDKGVGLGPGGVEVCHFFELCSKVLGEHIQFEGEDDEYYNTVTDMTIGRLQDGWKKYDAVLVDEGLEFSNEMAKVIFQLLDKARPNLTVALDESASGNDRDIVWKKHSPKVRVSMDRLSKIYRNTSELRRFALKFIGVEEEQQDDDFSTYCETHGPQPELRHMDGLDSSIEYVADSIKTLHSQGEYPLSEFAVLYHETSATGKGTPQVVELLMVALESRGIMSYWISEDYRARRSYDITMERVGISTIRNAAGLDYACVFLLGLDGVKSKDMLNDEAEKYVYNSIARARHRLFIPYMEKTPIIERLLSSR